ncbi:MAG: penicillin-binding protein 2 [Clostridiales bacterium]|nr:penicillin-binding protein 2 [Clostridiales bacterium]
MSELRRRKRDDNLISKKRLLFMRGIFFFVLLALTTRLFYIQVIEHDFYNAEVIKQRQVNIPVSSGRGLIYDRNFIRLTDRTRKKTVAIFPQNFIVNENNISLLRDITGRSYDELFNKVKNSKSVLEIPLVKELDWDDKNIINTKGLFIIDKAMRYNENGFLNHVIGYISQTDLKGMAGIEGALDGILTENLSNSLIATLDGRKRFLPGEGYMEVSSIKKNQNLRLTIDFNIQKIIENAIDEEKREGAVIVSDIQTGEILGMVSRPNFNPDNIQAHLKSKGDELYNKAIQMAFPPGSVFKIVVALEAMRQNPEYANEIFYCNGYELVGGLEIKCSSYEKGGHGEITMDRAFAESCNCAFIQLAEKLGAENIINMAENLGFNKIVDIGIKEEDSGNLPEGDSLLGPAFGNIAIGQGEILVTPLQINQLTQLVANDGLKKPLYIVKDIVDNNYIVLKTANAKEEKQVVDSEIANQVKSWMEKVMTEGTGQRAEEMSYITAGKTGSAEGAEKGKEVVHAWFTGYYPSNEPKYAITVFIQKGESGGGIAVPIFAEIVKEMINKGFK